MSRLCSFKIFYGLKSIDDLHRIVKVPSLGWISTPGTSYQSRAVPARINRALPDQHCPTIFRYAPKSALRVIIGVKPHVFGRQIGGPEAAECRALAEFELN